MNTNTFSIGANTIIEILSDDVLIKTEQDALDIMANCSSDFIILHDHNFEKDFFDLSTKKLGETLQKFTNYHIHLAIIGNFEKYQSQTLKDFIYESNKQKKYLFVSSLDEVKKMWA